MNSRQKEGIKGLLLETEQRIEDFEQKLSQNTDNKVSKEQIQAFFYSISAIMEQVSKVISFKDDEKILQRIEDVKKYANSIVIEIQKKEDNLLYDVDIIKPIFIDGLKTKISKVKSSLDNDNKTDTDTNRLEYNQETQRYNNLHCGQPLKIKIEGNWIKVRIELSGFPASRDGWYFIDEKNGFTKKCIELENCEIDLD